MASLDRAIVIVLDGVGVGQAPDAAQYGDEGSNCLTNTDRAIGGLELPEMGKLGLGNITPMTGTPPESHAAGAFGHLVERSPGKDSTTGHWELMGIILDKALPTYPHGFPTDLIARYEAAIGSGILGNKPASGTAIIEELGAEHMATGKPIVYTSADSVFQVAAHEDIILLPELYHLCEIARGMLTGDNAVGRVIARPFIGQPGSFTRTPHRRDFSLVPPADTLLDRLSAAGYPVIGLGKIEDLFAFRGLTKSEHPGTNAGVMEAAMREIKEPNKGLLFINFVDNDQIFGHRRNPAGYAQALQELDAWLPGFMEQMGPRDVLFITGDHGTDPTFKGTDHTREAVPLLAAGQLVVPNVNIGVRAGFSDLGATLAEAFDIPALAHGTSFARQMGLA